jgi:serine protease Do
VSQSLSNQLFAEVADRVRLSTVVIRSRAGGGAGTIWTSDGHIVTNHHVVPDGNAEVVLPDGSLLAGTVIARDEANDLALIKVEAKDLTPILSSLHGPAPRVGEFVVTVGHPWGHRGFVTAGIVSGPVARSWRGQARELIRADVRLAPGNSGGPLVDVAGQIVGINAMVDGGIALAVPAAVVHAFVRAAIGSKSAHAA